MGATIDNPANIAGHTYRMMLIASVQPYARNVVRRQTGAVPSVHGPSQRHVPAALAENFAQKMESYEDLPVAGVLALFRQAWAFEREQAEFRDDEDPAELASCGEILVAKYLDRGRVGISKAVLKPPARLAVHETADLAGQEYRG